ncbi:hypothetical protein ACRYI5_01765 [Furfurilactobacillus sp. WILCCON 0119]
MDIQKFRVILDDVIETVVPDVGPIRVITRKLGSEYYQFDITTAEDRFSAVEQIENNQCILHINNVPVLAAFVD